MLLVDSHCHLNFPDYKEDLPQVIAEARCRGVGIMQTICTEMAEFDEIHAIAQAHEGIYCSVGVHPNDSGKTDMVAIGELLSKSKLDKVIGIGETGLDYYYETSDRATQQESFRVHVEAALQSRLPLIVHTRDAEADTKAILNEGFARNQPLRGVLHCFTGTRDMAEYAVEHGFFVSFSGIVTFKSARELQEVAAWLPLEHMLIETDAPFLAPMPHRGKRNEPAFVSHTAEFLAQLRGITVEALAEATTHNFFRLFDRAKPPISQ